MEGLLAILGIGYLDAKYIEGLLDDMDKLNLDYPYFEKLISEGFLDIHNIEGYKITNAIIFNCLYSIANDFKENLIEYLEEEVHSKFINQLENMEIDIFTNCIDSHISIDIDDIYIDEYIIRDIYINDGIEEAYKKIKELLN